MAIKFTKGGTDGVTVLDIREILIQGIDAPLWTDLRVGWLLSITDAVNNDLTTVAGTPDGMVETLGVEPQPMLGWFDRVQIGLTDLERNQILCGYTNHGQGGNSTIGSTKLVTSDIGVGTTNSFYWRAKNEMSDTITANMWDGSTLAGAADGVQQHYVRTVGSVPGYASLHMLRFTRPDPNSRRITMTIPTMPSGHSSDVTFTSTPSEPFLRANLQNFPTTVQQLGPVNLSLVPAAFYVYWPFRKSRLRIHAMGVVKVK